MCKGIAAHSNTLYIILREIKLGQLHKRIIITEVSADDSEGFNLIFGAVTRIRTWVVVEFTLSGQIAHDNHEQGH